MFKNVKCSCSCRIFLNIFQKRRDFDSKIDHKMNLDFIYKTGILIDTDKVDLLNEIFKVFLLH